MTEAAITPRAWRKSKKLSMREAAVRAGVVGKNPGRTWQRWETGALEPPLAIVQSVSAQSLNAVTIESWREVRRQHLSAACIPAADDTAAHGDAASPDPIPETSAPPPLDHVTGDRADASPGTAG